MPTIPRGFKEAFDRIASGQTDTVSASIANKRFLAAQEADPGLTVEAFLSRPYALSRTREVKTAPVFIVGGVPVDASTAYDKVVALATATDDLCSKASFSRKASGLTAGDLVVTNLAALLPLVRKGVHVGATQWRVQPFLVETAAGWVEHPNGERVRDSIEGCEVGKRAFAERLQALVGGRATDGAVRLSLADLAVLGSKKGQRATLADVKAKINAHIECFGGRFLGFEADVVPVTVEAAYERYENERTKAKFSCAANDAHASYLRDFSHMGKIGCPVCGDAAARATRAKGEGQKLLRRRDREWLLGEIAAITGRWLQPQKEPAVENIETIEITQSLVTLLRESVAVGRKVGSMVELRETLRTTHPEKVGEIDSAMSVWAAVRQGFDH